MTNLKKKDGPDPMFHEWTVQYLEDCIAAYWDSRTATRKVYPRDGDPYEEEYTRPPTMAGLARAVGVSRMTLWRYLHRRDDLPSDLLLVLSRACDEISEHIEEALYNRETYQGARFTLEANHRYGREDERGGAGGSFSQTIIAPVEREDEEPLAIPRWDGE